MSHDPEALAKKSQLRIRARGRIAALSPRERSLADRAICQDLADLAEELGAAAVLAYVAFRDEVRVDGFLAEMVERGRATQVPRVVGRELRFANWRPAILLTRDETGTLAPESATSSKWGSAPSLIVVPGRVFDMAGGRVGRGQGYYDRLLSHDGEKPFVVGVAYECQLVERVPREAHDRDVDCLVTEAGRRCFGKWPGRDGDVIQIQDESE